MVPFCARADRRVADRRPCPRRAPSARRGRSPVVICRLIVLRISAACAAWSQMRASSSAPSKSAVGGPGRAAASLPRPACWMLSERAGCRRTARPRARRSDRGASVGRRRSRPRGTRCGRDRRHAGERMVQPGRAPPAPPRSRPPARRRAAVDAEEVVRVDVRSSCLAAALGDERDEVGDAVVPVVSARRRRRAGTRSRW